MGITTEGEIAGGGSDDDGSYFINGKMTPDSKIEFKIVYDKHKIFYKGNLNQKKITGEWDKPGTMPGKFEMNCIPGSPGVVYTLDTRIDSPRIASPTYDTSKRAQSEKSRDNLLKLERQPTDDVILTYNSNQDSNNIEIDKNALISTYSIEKIVEVSESVAMDSQFEHENFIDKNRNEIYDNQAIKNNLLHLLKKTEAESPMKRRKSYSRKQGEKHEGKNVIHFLLKKQVSRHKNKDIEKLKSDNKLIGVKNGKLGKKGTSRDSGDEGSVPKNRKKLKSKQLSIHNSILIPFSIP